jgi:NhaP-type Na+/H+ and K+/H+ antiporter
MVKELVEMTDEQMVADHNKLVHKYNDLRVKYVRLAAVLRDLRGLETTYHEIIAEHDDWLQLSRQKLNSTNEVQQ